MIKFAAHLESNYGKGVPFRDRWLTAKEHRFQGCEFVWRNVELAEAAALQQEAPIQVTSLGGTTGGSSGARPVLPLPEDRERLARDVETAAAYARKLNCRRLVFVPGNTVQGWSVERHRSEAVESLKYVAPILEQAGVTAIIEPLNSKVDHPGVYCDSFEEGRRLVELTGSPNVKLLYDAYHMRIMGEDIVQTIRDHHQVIGYYHLAKVPGRTEPIGGEIDVAAFIEAVAASGYDGFIGLEYKPSEGAAQSFERIKAIYPSYIS
ncbi:MAG: Hydroxypyruvate isomerase [Paenibacillus sp.]|jgi:hydroxypyruvate isomerase|nr:Hydroxypyruvate isomerase [Paenibacillus sp.]